MTLLTRYRRGGDCATIRLFFGPFNQDDGYIALRDMVGTRADLKVFWRNQWRSFLRPLNLTFVALAIAVMLLGCACKLSLYRTDHSQPLTVAIVKMWLGPEKTALTAGSRPRFQSRPLLKLASLPTSQFISTPVQCSRTRTMSRKTIALGGSCHCAATLRSPPAQHS